ncbi:MAG: LamG domain-containing protein, partial [Clostridia bacterium]|nr:LamG domain-containing protein [Clostridia bacterium]
MPPKPSGGGLTSTESSAVDEYLTVHYSFDDAEDLGKDETEYGRDAAETVAVTATEGVSGGAAYFSGGSNGTSYMRMNEEILDGVESFTLSFWTKRDSGNGNSFVISLLGDAIKSSPTDYIGFTNKDSTTAAEVRRSSSTKSLNLNTQPMSAGVWVHYAVTYDAETGSAVMYINGEKQVSLTGIDAKPSEFTGKLNYIARSLWSADKDYMGAVDEVKIYSKALTREELCDEIEKDEDIFVDIRYVCDGEIIASERAAEDFVESHITDYEIRTSQTGEKYYVVPGWETDIQTDEDGKYVEIELCELGRVYTIDTTNNIYYTSDDETDGEADFKAYVWAWESGNLIRIPFAELNVPTKTDVGYYLSATVTRRYDAGNEDSYVKFYAISTEELKNLDVRDAEAIEALATEENLAGEVSRIGNNTSSAALNLKLDDDVIDAAKSNGKVALFAFASGGLYRIKGTSMEIVSPGVFRISTADELYEFAEIVNAGEGDLWGSLEADIDLTGSEWISIGTESAAFSGVLD